MRARSLRAVFFILIVLGLALASLAFREVHVHVPGVFSLDRAGAGPLGLKLGLDLLGGSHLVYQADTGTRTEVTFAEDRTREQVEGALTGLGLPDLAIEQRSNRTYVLTTDTLNDAQRQEVRATLQAKVGAVATFQAAEYPPPTADQVEGAVDVIRRRVNLFGTDNPMVQRMGDDRIIVQLPGATGAVAELQFAAPVDAARLQGVLAEMGLAEARIHQRDPRSFRINTPALTETRRQALRAALTSRLGNIEVFQVTGSIDQAKELIGQTARLEFKERTCANPGCSDFTEAEIGLTGDDLESAVASTSPDTGEWVVNIQFKTRGAEIFSELTRRIQGVSAKRIAIFRDDELLVAPVARAWIRDGRSQIQGDFTREEARTLAVQLESGRLPVPLELVQESDVDALLGEESLRQSLIAGLVGLGVVIAFMAAYYRLAGVVAAVALVFYAVLMLAVFKLVPVTLTLAHIAGFILSIGMAVDANVLIFERMKEELRIGRTLASAIEVGFSRAWPAIRDGNISTIITCVIMLWFGDRLGGELVTGFALTLFIGVVTSMFTAVVVSRRLMELLTWAGLGRRVQLFTPDGSLWAVPRPRGER